MPFTMQNINYATDYAKALANIYPYLSYFSEVWAGPNTGMYRPMGGKTVMVPSMTVSGARAVNRDRVDGVFTRNFNNEWQPLTMAMDREWDTLVDPMDIQETNGVTTIANITKTFNEQQKVPEMDAYAASTMAGFAASYGGVDSTTLTAQNILAQWDAYLAYMTEHRVNRDRVVAYMTPDCYKLLKEAAGITRFIDTGTGIRGIDRNVGKLDGVNIRETPSDMLRSQYDFTEGWAAGSGAKQVNMLLVDPLAVVAPVVYDVSMVSAPTAQSKGKYLYYERYYYDVFGLNNRLAGFFANMSAPELGELTVTSAAGPNAGETILTASGGKAGVYGTKLMYSSGASAITLTYGGDLPSGSTWTEMDKTQVVSGLTAGQIATVALVNAYNGHVVAGGTATIVTKT